MPKSSKSGEHLRSRIPEATGRVPFAMAFVAEMLDGRMKAGDKLLLWWLRYRSGVNESTWVSWKTVAEELGESERMIRKRVVKLRDLGLLKCESRGFGNSQGKLVEVPSQVYPSQLICATEVGRMMRRDRTGDDLRMLRSIDLDNSDNSIAEPEFRNGDLDNADDPHCGTPVPIIPEQEFLSDRNHSSAKLDKDQLEKKELDPSPSGRREPQQAGTHDEGDSGLGQDQDPQPPFAEDQESKPEGERDSRLDEARRIQASTSRRTLSTAREKYEVRKARKAARDASGLTAAYREHMKKLQKENHKPSYKMGLFFEPVFRDHFPNDPWATWMEKEYDQANNLLRKYGDDLDLICEAWVYVCENWDEMRQKLKLDGGYPTVGLLLGLHARIFPLIAKSKTKRQEAESDQPSDVFGWE